MTRSTSISGMKLISGSSRGWVPRRFTARSLPTLAVRQLDQLDRLLFHFDDEIVVLGAEMAIEDHARNGDDQSERGVIRRHGDTMRQQNRVRTSRGLRPEDLDHADDGAEEAQQWRHRGDGAKRGEKTRKI